MFVVTLPKSADPETFAVNAKEAGADLLEIRGDLTPKIAPFISPLPLLISPRGCGIDTLKKLNPAYLDLELDENGEPPTADCKLIRSYHNYTATPSLPVLQSIALKLKAQSADIIKIATQINSFADLRTLQALQDSLPKNQLKIILGMGQKAHLNRLLSPLKNSFTYTCLESSQAAAPGQITLSLYQRTNHCHQPKIFGLLGGPDCTSFGPLLHNALYQHHNIDAIYSLFLTDDLADAWENLTTLGIAGFSVTAPFKQAIIPYLDDLNAGAKALKTVNTVIREANRWVGYVLDSEGLQRGYPSLKHSQSAAIIGSGGVVPSVIHACRQSGIGQIEIYARNESTGQRLSETFGVEYHSLEAISETQSDLLIYCISKDAEFTLATAKPGAQAIDLRYGRNTGFMEQAKQAGYIIQDGLPMFIHQALAQAELFTGIITHQADVELFQKLLKKNPSLPSDPLS